MGKWTNAARSGSYPLPVVTKRTVATEGSENQPFVTNVTSVTPPNTAEIIDLIAEYEERAAIREFDGGFPRAEAERLALEECAPDAASRMRLKEALRGVGALVPGEVS